MAVHVTPSLSICCTCRYTAKGGSGGGRILVNASSIYIDSGASISANGSAGSSYTRQPYRSGYSVGYFGSTQTVGGGGGSGGSIWLVSVSGGIDGAGAVEASGGSSTAGSGAGAGGRISLVAATNVSSSLTVRSVGGVGSTGYTSCGGAAGAIYAQDGSRPGGHLVVDNEQVTTISSSAIVTPYPSDVSGHVLDRLQLKGKARVNATAGWSNNNVSSTTINVGSGAEITGDTIHVTSTGSTTVAGTVSCTELLQVRSMGSAGASMRVETGGVVSCVSCEVDVALGSRNGSSVRLEGQINARTLTLTGELVEVLGSQTAWTGATSIEAERMIVGGSGRIYVTASSSTMSASASQNALSLDLGWLEVETGRTVSCSGTGCMSVVVNARDGMAIGGYLGCSLLKCRLGMTVGNATVEGTLRGGDVNLTAQRSVRVSSGGVIKADGLGHGNETGTGKGTSPTPGASASTSTSDWYKFYGSGGGGGYGGVGANSCFRYGSSAYVNPQTYGAGASYGESLAPQSFGSGGGDGQLFYVSSTASE